MEQSRQLAKSSGILERRAICGCLLGQSATTRRLWDPSLRLIIQFHTVMLRSFVTQHRTRSKRKVNDCRSLGHFFDRRKEPKRRNLPAVSRFTRVERQYVVVLPRIRLAWLLACCRRRLLEILKRHHAIARNHEVGLALRNCRTADLGFAATFTASFIKPIPFGCPASSASCSSIIGLHRCYICVRVTETATC
jgi:hypothetical protein